MRGSLLQRGENTWLLRLEFGYVRDPQTGRVRRIQKTQTFIGTRQAAERRLNALTSNVQDGTYIEPDKRTVAQWLDEWVDLAIKPPRRTARAYETYRSVIALHLNPSIGHHRLQELRAIHIEACLAAKTTLSQAMLEKIFMVLSGALKAATNNRLVARNEAASVSNKPRAPEQSSADVNCWTGEEAAAFLRTARAVGPQPAALWTLALDSGMRRSELAGLPWSDVDLTLGRVRVRQQLLTGGREPVFVPTKGKRTRTIPLATETVELLKTHRAHQASLKMRHRQDYHDGGLVFGKEPSEAGRRHADVFGTPLGVNNIAERELNALIAAAGVRRITIHGLRHTCASLLLAAGVAPHVVQQRLGHKDASTTLNVYSHVLPGQQEDAARRLASLLYRP